MDARELCIGSCSVCFGRLEKLTSVDQAFPTPTRLPPYVDLGQQVSVDTGGSRPFERQSMLDHTPISAWISSGQVP